MKVTDEMAAGAPVKNVDTSPERDKKSDDSLHDKRVEAGARVLRERLFPGVDLPLGDSAWVGHAREVLRAADAVVTDREIGRLERADE